MSERTHSLLKMLKYRRPAGSATEKLFIDRFIRPLGVQEDHFGNLIKQIGKSNVLWSCHTDTVHRVEGVQNIRVDANIVSLANGSASNCLGADCGTGVWLMTEMIKAKVPGLYIFHREEECGGGGSSFIADKTPEVLKGIDIAIAFDRYGTNSVITHQFGRCCSNAFAETMVDQLEGFMPDDTGIFTDTANYTGIVPECTNISVGYDGHHTQKETQNLKFADYLLDKMIALDTSKLAVERDPSVMVYDQHWYWNQPSHGGSATAYNYREDDFESLVKRHPEEAASLMEELGISVKEFENYIYSVSGYIRSY